MASEVERRVAILERAVQSALAVPLEQFDDELQAKRREEAAKAAAEAEAERQKEEAENAARVEAETKAREEEEARREAAIQKFMAEEKKGKAKK